MKLFQIVILLLGTGTSLSAQNTDAWFVLASQGGTAQGEHVQLAWTLGEPATSTVTTASGLQTAGFQQPVLQVEQIQTLGSAATAARNETGAQTKTINVFPNPTAGQLQITVQDGSAALIRLALMDQNGRLLSEQILPEPVMLQIDLQTYPAGMYLLRIQSATNTINDVYQIIH